jgi:hypothetical protein
MEVRELDLSEWGTALPDSKGEVFHRPAALSVLETYSPGYDLRLYGGFKGDRAVGLLPLFVRELPLGGRIVSSPPPGRHVPHLGPVVMTASPKQSKRERVNSRFVGGVLDLLDLDARSLLYVLSSPEYEDPRPFVWKDQSVNVSFTYDLDVGEQSPDDVLKTFSKSRRREIRNGADLEVTVGRGDVDDVRRVYDQTRNRFSEQDEYFGLSWPFVRDLYEELGDHARVYVARDPDGEFLSGILSLYSGDAASFWLGGVRTDYDGVSMNTLLHWEIVRDVAEDPELDGITRYDMVGAGEYRLSKYKSKFNPTLRQYYVVSSGGAKMEMAKSAYAGLSNVQSRVPDAVGFLL